jgi:wyosine [tRNA(Phe)-imidazoG37] synthetase (radical SAM superfamily)
VVAASDGGGATRPPEGARELSIVFGPVPSRRLGRSLGINNIPPKACAYSCVYCQAGPTRTLTAAPGTFYPPLEVVRQVVEAVEQLRGKGEPIDYLTFVPDGEPTLDMGLEQEIDLLRPLGIPVAVISNASLLWRPEVARALSTADWVSVKVDTVDERIWHRVNRPHRGLDLPVVLEAIRRFSAGFGGRLVSETMLVTGVNDGEEDVEVTARFLAGAGIGTAYLSVPIRPPAVAGVEPPAPAVVNRAYQIMAGWVTQVELLTTPEDDTFASSTDPGSGILAICAVHPMREGAVQALLDSAGAPWSVVECLISEGRLKETSYQGERFFLLPLGDR